MSVVILIVGILLGCSGCGGGDTGTDITLTGTVTRNAEPFSEASIHFTQVRTGADFGVDLNEDGTYSIDILSAESGDDYGVSFGPILAPSENPKLDGAGVPLPNPAPDLPKIYLDHTTNDLTVELEEASSQTFDFALDAK